MLIDWRVAASAAVFCTSVLLTCIETNAQAIPKEVAARVEMHTIPSLTLSDQKFLAGDVNGAQPVTMTAMDHGKAPAKRVGTAARCRWQVVKQWQFVVQRIPQGWTWAGAFPINSC